MDYHTLNLIDNLLFKFPFVAEVWGTVSDWVMVVVTAITAYFLWRTLQEQKEFTKIELERFARENPPTFTSSRNLNNRRGNYPNPLRFKVILKNNRLKNLSIEGDFPEGFMVSHNYPTSESLPPDSTISLAIEADRTTTRPSDCTGKIIFQYDDMLNNRYSQILQIDGANHLSWKAPYKISN